MRSFIKNIRDRLKKFTKPKKIKQTETEAEAASVQEKNKKNAISSDNGKFADSGKHGKSDGTDSNGQDKKPRRRRRPRKKNPRQKPVDSWDLSTFHVPPEEGKTRFHDLGLPDQVMHAIFDLGYQYCTPIQADIMPEILNKRDAFGRAQTGTGKTAAFLIAAITKIITEPDKKKRQSGTPRILILGPTRELVIQIAEEASALSKYCSVNILTVFGGMDYRKQLRKLEQGRVDIIVATPGRLLDFKRSRNVFLDQVQILVIDEGDRMLDMGFIPDVRRIIRSTPYKDKRQTMLFSATLTPEVTRFASQWTRNSVVVEIDPEQVEVDSVNQIVYLVTIDDKYALLLNIILSENMDRVIVFCNRRNETRMIEDLFRKYNINCAVLSGEVRQKKRLSTLENFKTGKTRVLVATDVAGRGIHVDGVSHVINYALPNDPEDYVHRIGRTGRAGSTGTSISFACEEDSFYIPPIEKYLGHSMSCIQPEEEWLVMPVPPPKKHKPKKKSGGHKKRRYNPRNSSGNKNSGNKSSGNKSSGSKSSGNKSSGSKSSGSKEISQ
ncbi:DEAD/DEAH box helicase [Desulfobacterales bacterium HSG16]|nr:DEAD/DEAH box helicase [Desulfobacterales bacterium HSG16]